MADWRIEFWIKTYSRPARAKAVWPLRFQTQAEAWGFLQAIPWTKFCDLPGGRRILSASVGRIPGKAAKPARGGLVRKEGT